MINKLTAEQESKKPEFIDKWVNIASQPMDEKAADESMRKIYNLMEEKYDGIVVGDSPITTSMFFLVMKNLLSKDNSLDNSLGNSLDNSLYSSLGNSLDNSLDNSLKNSLYNSLGNSLYNSLDNSLENSLYSSLYNSLGNSLYNSLDNSLDNSLGNSLYSSLYNSLDSSSWYLSYYWLTWCGLYDFGNYIGVKFDEEKYNLFMKYNMNHHFVIPCKGICFTSRKPDISWKNDVIHNDTDMAIKYRDGWGVWALNGVVVPKELVTTPASKLDVEFYKNEKKADVKAEFIRKYGIDRMANMGKVVDTWEKYKSNQWWVRSEYELIDMSSIFKSIEFAPHIKMKNQTTGIYHLEAVPPECDTLEKAMKFRQNNKSNLETLNIK